MHLRFILCSLLVMSACKGDSLASIQSNLLSDEVVDLGTVYVGSTAIKNLELQAEKGTVTVSNFEVLGDVLGDAAMGVSSEGTLTILREEKRSIDLEWSPTAAGTLEDVELVLGYNGESERRISVLGSAVVGPDCDDGNPCTADIFNTETESCTHGSTNGSCDDGNLCTVNDQCFEATCTGTASLTVDPSCQSCNSPNPCFVGNIDPESGECTFTETDALCDDQDACTIGDQCSAGYCTGTYDTATCAPGCDPDGRASESPFSGRWFEEAFARADNDIWLVGKGGVSVNYNGSDWQVIDTCSTGTLYSVHGSVNGTIYAVGAGGVVLENQGGGWTDISPSALTKTMRAVWAYEDGHIFVGGDSGEIWELKSGQWTKFNTPGNDLIWSLWGRGPDDVWAVGEDGLLMHYDGSVWEDGFWNGDKQLFAVRGNESSIYVVGSGGTLLSFNLGSFVELDAPTNSSIYNVLPLSDELWLSGDNGSLFRFHANTWSDYTLSGAGTMYALNGINSENIVSGSATGLVALISNGSLSTEE